MKSKVKKSKAKKSSVKKGKASKNKAVTSTTQRDVLIDSGYAATLKLVNDETLRELAEEVAALMKDSTNERLDATAEIIANELEIRTAIMAVQSPAAPESISSKSGYGITTKQLRYSLLAIAVAAIVTLVVVL